MKVFLTGASGFIGSHVGLALTKAGHELICLKRKSSDLNRCAAYQGKVTWLDCDSEDWANQVILNQPDAIIHCAWSGVTAAEREDFTVQVQNVIFFSELLSIAQKTNLKRFIALGSQAEYGNINERVNELHPLLPNTAYGATKAVCLTLLETFVRQTNLSYAWLRLFSIYGPGENGQWFIPSLVRQMRNRETPQLTGCEQRYDYLHVSDLATGILTALEKTSESGVFNLTSNQSVALKEIVKLIQQLTGCEIEPRLGALPYRPNQSMHMEGDSNKFFTRFGFAPELSLEEGLRELIEQQINHTT